MKLTVTDLAKSYGGRDLFAGFSMEVAAGSRLAVVGPNGAGKSTLLKLFAGEAAPDAGAVSMPKGARLGYVAQELSDADLEHQLLPWVLEVLPSWKDFWEEWEAASNAGDQGELDRLARRQAEMEAAYGYSPEHKAKAVLSGLGFAEAAWREPMRRLSGGWRERAKLARVLTAGADILLLDEPTNHLDLEAVEWLEEFLLCYEGVLIFVAHDRVFMDRVASQVLFLGGSRPLVRDGSYSQFLTWYEDWDAQKAREQEKLKADIARKQAFIDRFGAKATKARQSGSRKKMVERLQSELEGITREPRRKSLDFAWPKPKRADKTVANVVGLEFAYPDGTRLWPTLDFSLYRGQKTALVGPNGCGKSTLLKLVTGALMAHKGSVQLGQAVDMAVFSQHQLEILKADRPALAEIRRLSDPRTTEQELMSVLGLFMLGEAYHDRKVGALSGGEKSRLILATLFLKRANFLVLDEPTNHLDLESREALIGALEDFEGTLLFVAHDRWLLSRVAREVWELTPGGFVEHRDFGDYEAARRAQAKEAVAAACAPPQTQEQGPRAQRPSLSREEQKRLKREQAQRRNAIHRELKPLQAEYDRLEAALEKDLAELDAVEKTLADPAVYNHGNKASELLKRYEELKNSSDRTIEAMQGLEERINGLAAEREDLAGD